MVEFYTEKLVPVPENCTVTFDDRIITIKCGDKSIQRNFRHIVLTMDLHENNVRLRLWNGRKQERSKLITCSSHIRNMITGVTKGFECVLKAAYVHFPIAFGITDNGKKLTVKNFIGEKTARVFQMRGDSVVRIGTDKDTVVISGTNIEDVTQSAGNVKRDCVPKNFDIRKFMDGVYVAQRRIVGE